MEEKNRHLTDALYELSTLETLLKYATDEKFVLDEFTMPALHLLVGVTWKKLHYYEDKYSLRIPYADDFFPEEIVDHIDFNRASGPDLTDDDKTVDVKPEVANRDMLKLAETILNEAKEKQRYKLMEAITNVWAEHHEKAPTDSESQ